MNLLLKVERAFEGALPAKIGQRYQKLSEELRRRIFTAFIGVLVMTLLLTFGGTLGAVLLAAVLISFMLREFSSFVFSLHDANEKSLVLTSLGWLIPFLKYWFPGGDYALFLLYFIGLILYFVWNAQDHKEKLEEHFKELMAASFGLLYLGFLMSGLVGLRTFPYGQQFVFLFFIIVWASDTGAYFGGHRFGKTLLFPVLSPKKTLEGLGVGLATALVLALGFKFAFFNSYGIGATIITTLLVGLSAAVGDLFESFLKRAYHTKDSGNLLPGHGGFLDRFDGVVFGLPIMLLCASLFLPN